jgi:hypothetical protein
MGLRAAQTILLFYNYYVDRAAQCCWAGKVSRHHKGDSGVVCAYLMEFHVFDTEPLRLLTYCIATTGRRCGEGRRGDEERERATEGEAEGTTSVKTCVIRGGRGPSERGFRRIKCGNGGVGGQQTGGTRARNKGQKDPGEKRRRRW